MRSLLLCRMCVWECIALKRSLRSNWNDPNPKAKKAVNPMLVPGTVLEHYEEPAGDNEEMKTALPIIDMYSPSAINTKYFKFVLTQIPHYITPMYQGNWRLQCFLTPDYVSAMAPTAICFL